MFNFKPILALVLLLSSATSFAKELPEKIRPAVKSAVELNREHKYLEALGAVRLERAKHTQLSDEESLIFANLEILQLIHLEEFTAAETLILAMLELPDQDFRYSALHFGQKSAVANILRELLASHNYGRGRRFITQILMLRPGWRLISDSSLARVWTNIGEIQFRVKDYEKAQEAWELAQHAWETKSLHYQQQEPENARKYLGSDRYNPFQVAIEAKLLAVYRLNKEDQSIKDLQHRWTRQNKNIAKANPEAPEKAQQKFQKTITQALENTEQDLNQPNLKDLYKVPEDLKIELCEADLKEP